MPIPGWTIGLALKAIAAWVKHRKNEKRRRSELQNIRREVPEMKGLGAIIGWVLKFRLFEKYRRKIGIGLMVAGGIVEGLNATLALFPEYVGAALIVQKIGAYVAIIGAAFKDDYPKK